jgi:NAD(P)-dependent dehydrogenase (short-subunit alcohol dehydrogenase family)
MELKDRVAVITGATGGLGRVVSHRFAEMGARMALASTDPEKLTRLANELQLPADRLLTYDVDLTLPESAQGLKDAVLEKFGRVDILLHFVGGWIGGKSLAQVTAEEVNAMLRQHLWTTFHLAQAFVPPLVANGWGRIVVVSHPDVSTLPAKVAPYTIGKSAQEALVLTLAAELRETGVTANILRVRHIDVKLDRDRERTPKNASWTTPEEICSAILYLCSEEAGVVNGARVPLHGGG